MASSADIVVNVLARTAAFNRRMDRVGRQLTTVEKAAKKFQFAFKAAGAAIVAFGTRQLSHIVRQNLRLAGTLTRVAETTKFTTDQVQELRFAAEQLNMQSNTVDLGLQRFSRRLGEAAQGTGELIKTAKQYNVQLFDQNGRIRANGDVLRDFANIIANAKDEQERLRIAFKLFDSEGAGLVRLLEQGEDGLDKFAQAARDAGVVMDNDIIKNAAEADRVLNLVDQTLRAKLFSVIAQNADEFARFAETLGTIAEKSVGALSVINSVGNGIATGAQGIGEFFGRITAGKALDEYEVIFERIKVLQADRAKLQQQMNIEEPVRRMLRVEERLAEVTREINQLLEQRNQLARGEVAATDRRYEANKRNAAAERKAEELAAKSANVGTFSTPNTSKFDKAIADRFGKQVTMGVEGGLSGGVGVAGNIAMANADKAQQVLDEQLKKTQAVTDATRELGFTFTSAFEDAIIEGRKFGDVLKGVFDDLLRLFIRTGITGPAAAGLGDFFKGMFTRDSGGTYSAGQPFISRTPELIIPSGSGRVKPSLAGVGGGGVNITNNIQIDSRADRAQIMAELTPMLARVSDATVARVQQLNKNGRLGGR